MERPDLDTLACVNAECALHRKTHQGNLGVRKVYGRDALRLLRCRTCGEEFSERRGTAWLTRKYRQPRLWKSSTISLMAVVSDQRLV